MLWTNNDLSHFFANMLFIALFFIACVLIWIGFLKTRDAHERQEADRQARLRAHRQYVPTLNHEYAALYLLVVEFTQELADELQKKQ